MFYTFFLVLFGEIKQNWRYKKKILTVDVSLWDILYMPAKPDDDDLANANCPAREDTVEDV